ncbi:hypothetical protein [Arthrobacter rhombi]|uniref:hypothetical protein n=1 Tax=Arthrobacter rhombi TaxID=71253 RepID=UPI003FD52341
MAAPDADMGALVETGRTFAEEWHALDGDTTAQRSLIASAIDHVEIQPVIPGAHPRRWDERRATIRWNS